MVQKPIPQHENEIDDLYDPDFAENLLSLPNVGTHTMSGFSMTNRVLQGEAVTAQQSHTESQTLQFVDTGFRGLKMTQYTFEDKAFFF